MVFRTPTRSTSPDLAFRCKSVPGPTEGHIAAGLSERLGNDRRTEIETALREIGRIAWYRLGDVVGEDDHDPGTDATGGDSETPLRSPTGSMAFRSIASCDSIARRRAHSRVAFTGRDNNLLACEVDVGVFGDEFSPPTPRATTRCSSRTTA